MTSLEDIYYADSSWIRNWLTQESIDLTDNDLLNRLNVTILINNQGLLSPSDEIYVADPDFIDLYLASDAALRNNFPDQDLSSSSHLDLVRKIIDQRRIPEECQSLLSLNNDITGLRIFNIFVKKSQADNIYGRERDRILFFYNTKQLTLTDRDTLLAIVNDFEMIYNLFIQRVEKERIFYEKAGSGKPPRKIITPEDWAEAIIELQDTSMKFKQVIDDNIRLYVNPERLKAYCEKTSFDRCEYPCTKQPNVFLRGGSCLYKR
jgi:hypothetical protein